MINSTSNAVSPGSLITPFNKNLDQVTANPAATDQQQSKRSVQANQEGQGVQHHRHGKHHEQGQPAQASNDGSQLAASSVGFQSIASSLSSSFSLELTTQEGDVVSIGFSYNASQQQSALQGQSAGGQWGAMQVDASESTQFSLSVRGNLSAAEQKSVQGLMQQIQQVGTDFFSGNSKNIMQQAQNMGFDAEQIAGFSLSMNMEKSVQAVSAYQQASELQSVDPQILKQAGSFFSDALNSIGAHAGALQVFADPQGALQGISSGMVDVLGSQQPPTPDRNQQVDNLQKLMSLISSMVFDPGNTANNVPLQVAPKDQTTAVDTQA